MSEKILNRFFPVNVVQVNPDFQITYWIIEKVCQRPCLFDKHSITCYQSEELAEEVDKTGEYLIDIMKDACRSRSVD